MLRCDLCVIGFAKPNPKEDLKKRHPSNIRSSKESAVRVRDPRSGISPAPKPILLLPVDARVVVSVLGSLLDVRRPSHPIPSHPSSIPSRNLINDVDVVVDSKGGVGFPFVCRTLITLAGSCSIATHTRGPPTGKQGLRPTQVHVPGYFFGSERRDSVLSSAGVFWRCLARGDVGW